jgi:plastocyanin
MKKMIATAAAVAVAAGAFAVPSLAGSTSVSVKDNKFAPKSLTVSKGTTVRWVWKGKAPHNVTVVSGPVAFRSSNKRKGSYSHKFTKRGTYRILCTIHAPGMKMTVKVK